MANQEHKSGKNQKTEPPIVIPQPLEVKISKGRNWTKKDLYSLIPIVISCAALIFAIKGFSNTKKSVDAQINAIAENQRQFAILNKSYIQIDSLRFLYFNTKDSVTFLYNVENLGNQPAKILKRKTAVTISGKNPFTPIDSLKLDLTRSPTMFLNVYVRNKPTTLYDQNTLKLDDITMEYLRQDNLFFYFHGRILFKNLVTDKYGVCDFCYYIDTKWYLTKNQLVYSIVNNENKDIDNPSEF